MKRFQFKLEAVLQDRKRTEDLRLREWTLARRIVMQMQEELRQLVERLRLAFEEASLAGGLQNIGMVQTMDDFIDGTKIRTQWKKQDIERAEKLTEKKRLEYVRERQKREALEKLKERQLEEYKSAVRKKEFKDLDELYIMSAGYKRNQNEEDDWEAME